MTDKKIKILSIVTGVAVAILIVLITFGFIGFLAYLPEKVIKALAVGGLLIFVLGWLGLWIYENVSSYILFELEMRKREQEIKEIEERYKEKAK